MSQKNPIATHHQHQLERLRGRCLRTVYYGGSGGVSDRLIVQVVNDDGGTTDRDQVREAIGYLELMSMVTVVRRATAWEVKTTAEGAQVVEGNLECPAGIEVEG